MVGELYLKKRKKRSKEQSLQNKLWFTIATREQAFSLYDSGSKTMHPEWTFVGWLTSTLAIMGP